MVNITTDAVSLKDNMIFLRINWNKIHCIKAVAHIRHQSKPQIGGELSGKCKWKTENVQHRTPYAGTSSTGLRLLVCVVCFFLHFYFLWCLSQERLITENYIRKYRTELCKRQTATTAIWRKKKQNCDLKQETHFKWMPRRQTIRAADDSVNWLREK